VLGTDGLVLALTRFALGQDHDPTSPFGEALEHRAQPMTVDGSSAR
jgi:hypothetical protein